MKLSTFLITSIFVGATTSSAQEASWGETQKVISAWHGTQPVVDGNAAKPPVLRVVYFHGNDMEPLKGYQSRLTRVMDDVSEFYADGMELHGMVSKGIPLEKNDDEQLILHVVKGKHAAAHYDYKSGGETEAEMRLALAGKIDFDREFVLALYGQCWKMEDGRYGFYSPYYGKVGSNQRWGFCHAADCDLLDPKLLTDTKNRFKYWEHYGDRDQTVAKFNSFYIGGIAHELGHGLGLPHDGETQVQRFKKGRSLMGNGNLTYREELWKPKSKGSFLSLASAARLVSHPLFTGSNAGRFTVAEGAITQVKAIANGDQLELSGTVVSTTPSYAVVAYIDPEGGGGYDAKTRVARTDGDGKFAFSKMEVPRSKTQIRLVACFVNGETTQLESKVNRSLLTRKIDAAALFAVDPDKAIKTAEAAVAAGRPDAPQLVARAKASLKPDGDAKLHRQLVLLERWLRPVAELTDLATMDGASCYLSDARWDKASAGWAGTPRDRWGAEPKYGQGLFLHIAGELHEKGLPAHCPAEHVFTVDEKWDRFQATVGLRDGTSDAARAIFEIYGDGKKLYRSEQLAPGKTDDVDIDISGVKSLQLLTVSGMDHTHTCWAIWGSAKVLREEVK